MVYLDYNATAPMKPAVRAAVLEAMERTGNPSSVHRYGRVARRHIEEARAKVAALVGVKSTQVILTGGGTEANTMAAGADGFAVVSAIEHDSILANAPNSNRIPVHRNGVVDLNAAAALFSSTPAGIVAIMLVNNETGVIQPVAEISALAKAHGHRVHVDAIQAPGRLPLDLAAFGADSMSLSAHKIGGPQGVGALIVAEKYVVQPLLRGGGQEMNRRAGTENVAGIVGFGVAAQLAADDLRNIPQIRQWRDQLQAEILAIGGDDVVVIGETAERVANTLCVALRNVSNETQVVAMDLAGVAVSSGSACSSGKVKASHVLRAMGYGDDIATAALRLSLGWDTQARDLTRCIEAWKAMYGRTRTNAETHSAAA